MASIFYAWELGGGFGHVGAFMPLAQSLRDAGYDVKWAVSQPAEVGAFLARNGFTWLPAPNVAEKQHKNPPLNYADILLRYGYDDAEHLFGLVGAWRTLMQVSKARLVLVDHAPTALIAARTLGLPVMLFSSGFAIPPMRYPLPNMRPWASVTNNLLEQFDDQVCRNINVVLKEFACQGIDHVARLFDVEEPAVLTFPELDHYQGRGLASYWGSLYQAGGGVRVSWMDNTLPRIFAYLRFEVVQHVALLELLVAMDVQCVVYFPGIDPALKERFARSQLQFTEHPLDIGQVMREVDYVITYANLLTTTAALLAGKPLLLLPFHLEQFLLAQRVETLGAGIMVRPEATREILVGSIQQLVHDDQIKNCAELFARKYANFDQQSVLRNLMRRCADLLSKFDTRPESSC